MVRLALAISTTSTWRPMPVSVCQRRRDTPSIAQRNGLPTFRQLWQGSWESLTTSNFFMNSFKFFISTTLVPFSSSCSLPLPSPHLSLSLSLSLSLFCSLKCTVSHAHTYTYMSVTCRVDVIVKRCGGGFGGKISRPNLIAAATALGAYVTKR